MRDIQAATAWARQAALSFANQGALTELSDSRHGSDRAVNAQHGQSRALLVWNRLIMPNGWSIVLERQPGADAEGYAGLEDEVDNHWGMLFKAAILSTVLSVGSEAGMSGNSNGSLAEAIQQGMSQSINQTGQQVVNRSLSIQPTITIRPGFPARVMVTHDLVLEPYRA